jgi:hypothetical protein
MIAASVRYRDYVKQYANSELSSSIKRLRSGDSDELSALDDLIDSLDGLSLEAKNQLKKDMRWLMRWGPLIGRFGQFYLFCAEFGAQMVISLFFALVLLGVLSYPLWSLFAALYALLLVANYGRYRFGRAFAERGFLLLYGEKLSSRVVQSIRWEYIRITILQAVSLLVALSFSVRIVIGGFPWASKMDLGSYMPFLSNVMGNAISNLAALALGWIASVLARSRASSPI